jgi:imidazolonepropionase-like amidohydrolase
MRIPTLAIAALLTIQYANAQTTLIRAGQLIDPATGTVSPNVSVLVKDGKITAVGDRIQAPPLKSWISRAPGSCPV